MPPGPDVPQLGPNVLQLGLKFLNPLHLLPKVGLQLGLVPLQLSNVLLEAGDKRLMGVDLVPHGSHFLPLVVNDAGAVLKR